MAPIDREFTDVWEGVLRDILAWSDTKIERFVSRWQAVEDLDGPNSLTHDWPTNYVVPLCIPERLRVTLRAREGHAFERLSCRLQDIVIEEVRSKQRCSDVDWNVVKKSIVSALSEFGYALPTADESFNYWIENRAPSLERDAEDD